jgi:uncharacterized protein YjdB
VGQIVALSATARDDRGNIVTGRSFTWSSSDPDAAAVDQHGVVTPAAVGPVTITATTSGVNGSAVLNIVPVAVASVSVSPADQLMEVGDIIQLQAVARDAAGRALEGRAMSWSSNNTAIASVSATGLVTALAEGGPVRITATSEGRSGTATLLVVPATVGTVVVAPQSATIQVGASTQLHVFILSRGGAVLEGRAVTWSSSQPLVASVTNSGVVTGHAAGGPVTITANSEGVSGSAQITVSALPVSSVQVIPPVITLIVGETVQFIAQAFNQAGGVVDAGAVTWTSSDVSVLTIEPSGLALAVGSGPVEVTATVGGVSGFAQVTVVGYVGTGITNIVQMLERCPANDPLFTRLQNDIQLRADGVLVTGNIPCSEPYSAQSSAQLTDELIALQAMRVAFYMGQGTAGRLPWTDRSFYLWITQNIGGINLKAGGGTVSCCESIAGRMYLSVPRMDEAQRLARREWPGISTSLAQFAHAIRRAQPGAPGLTSGCAAAPADPAGCEASYNLANLGPYGVQYWLQSNWATGFLNVGIACAPVVAESYAQSHADNANQLRSRFVTNPPPMVTLTPPYGGVCR